MDRRLLLPLMLVLGCAEGSLEGPGSFGLPVTGTMTTQADTEDDDGETEDDDDTDDGDGDGDGDTGSGSPSSTDPSTDTAQDSSSSAPITTAEDSSDDSASVDDSASASAEESSSSDPSASASDSNDDGVEPPGDAGAWDNCEAALCDPGNDCITVNGVVGEAYCAPQCVVDFDCPLADTGDATPFCLLIGEGADEPTNCALICEIDGFDYGACPNGMSCTSVPGQDPSISLCMW